MPTFVSETFRRFVFVGIGNTILGMGVIFAAMQTFPLVAANLIGYLVVVPLSFVAHRQLSFRHRGLRFPAFIKYVFVVFVGYLTNLFVLTALSQHSVNPYLSQACAICSHVLVTYLLSRSIVFKERECE